MVLNHGEVSTLKDIDWYCLELRSEQSAESTLRRLAAAMPRIFGKQAAQLFVPVGRRDLDLYELSAGELVFVRAASLKLLLRLKTVTGAVGLLCSETSANWHRKPIPVEDIYVQTLIRDAEQRFHAHCAGVKLGSFVRLLNGRARGYCGHVTGVTYDYLTVRVTLRAKNLLVHTPHTNVLNLDHVPQDRQTFFYNPLIADADPSLLATTEDDVVLDHDDAPAFDDDKQLTVTKFVRQTIAGGMHDMHKIMVAVAQQLANKNLRMPKNTIIVANIIKIQMVELVFAPMGIKTFKQAKKKYGITFCPAEAQIILKAAGVKLEIGTPEDKLRVHRFGEDRIPRKRKRYVPIPENLKKKRGPKPKKKPLV